MNKILKSVLAVSISSALMSFASYSATYEVVDKGNSTTHKYTSAQSENANGVMAITASKAYNLPVQFNLLTEDDYTAIEVLAFEQHEIDTLLVNIEDDAALRAGNPTANDFAWVIRYLESKGNDPLYQKISRAEVMVSDGSTVNELTIFDTTLSDGNISRSTNDTVQGITEDSWLYGIASAPSLPVEFTDSNTNTVTYWLNDFTMRGFVALDNGATIHEIVPTEARYGGESGIADINNNRYGVGFESTKVSQAFLERVEDDTGGCADDDVLKDISFDACVWKYRNAAASLGAYHIQATLFQFDEQGNVISKASLGNLITPHPDDERVYKSYALALNNNNVAVGYASGWVSNDVTEPSSTQSYRNYAVLYKDGQVLSLSDDHENDYGSRANDINDAGVAVGYITKFVNGSLRTKFFYTDTTSEELTMVLPNDFFTGSSSIAKSINEQGLIVGDGEVETKNSSSQNPRRRHGFLYDINTDTFTDLNSFLSCDSPYSIVSANDINEQNEISATAVVKVPRRDAFGEIVVDSDGNELTEDVIRAVSLKPINGEIEDCAIVEEKSERKGASFGYLSLLLLLPLVFRRKIFS
jgi:hypothetical protein